MRKSHGRDSESITPRQTDESLKVTETTNVTECSTFSRSSRKTSKQKDKNTSNVVLVTKLNRNSKNTSSGIKSSGLNTFSYDKLPETSSSTETTESGPSREIATPNSTDQDVFDVGEEECEKVRKRPGEIFNDQVIEYLAQMSFTRADKDGKGTLTLETFAKWVYNEPLVYPLFGIEDGEKYDTVLFSAHSPQPNPPQPNPPQPKKKTKGIIKRAWPNIINLYRVYSALSDGTGINKKLFIWGLKLLNLDEDDVPVDMIYSIFDKNESGYLSIQQIIVSLTTVFMNEKMKFGDKLAMFANMFQIRGEKGNIVWIASGMHGAVLFFSL